jgi:hypothetical protein
VERMVIAAKQKPQPLILDGYPTENICQEKYRDHTKSLLQGMKEFTDY